MVFNNHNISCESGSTLIAETVTAYGQPEGAENIGVGSGAKAVLLSVKDDEGRLVQPVVHETGKAQVGLDDRDYVLVSTQNAALL